MIKKFSFYASAAMLAVGALLTSCSSTDYCPYASQVKVINIVAEKNTIVVSSNEQANFTIDATADKTEVKADKKGATFSGIDPSKKTVNVTATLVNAAGFAVGTQTATVKFSEKSTNASISFDFVKKSTDTKSQADVAASATDVTVTSNTNPSLTAKMTIPGGTLATGGTGDDFSITAYETTPSVVDEESITVGQPVTTEESKVMVLDCTPDGATFDQPLTLVVNVGKELTGETIYVKNNNEKVSGVVDANGDVAFSVTHFSAWNVLFDPIVSSKSVNSVSLGTFTVDAVEGNNTFSYTKNVGVGFDCTGLMKMFINTIFGQANTRVSETGTFTSTGAGKATINIYQSYVDYTFTYGRSKTFSARVWGNVTTVMEIVPADTPDTPDTPGHSGGSGN